MIPFDKALELILKNTVPLSLVKTKLSDSVGMILKEDVFALFGMPPFNKSAMDGYAIKAADVKATPVTLKCIGTIHAGENFRKKIRNGECVKIMTGACLPTDTDSVVQIENTTQHANGYIEINSCVKKGGNVCLKGEDFKIGQKILGSGAKISIGDISLLAAAGRHFFKVVRSPRVAIINTGNEIIPLGRKLRKNEIYNSNGPQMEALLKSDNIEFFSLGIARDNEHELTKFVKKGLEFDVLLISGGVSMGDYDLVPEILKNAGVKKIFHNVRMKPGKPLFFGKKNKTLVFGVPGNPLANFVIYQMFIQSALKKMMGHKKCTPDFKKGLIKKTFINNKTDRQRFIPIKILTKDKKYYLTPLSSNGSADIFSLSQADGFMLIKADMPILKKNSLNMFFTWEK